MRLTAKEIAIIEHVVEKQNQGLHETTVDALLEKVYSDASINKPGFPRQAMNSTLRNLGAKLRREGFRFRRESQIGRGNKGTYQFYGDFAELLKSKKDSSTKQLSL